MTVSGASAQRFGKANPGYIVTKKDGVKQEGFVKVKSTNEKDGILDLYFQTTPDEKKPKVVKVKDLSEYLLNNTYYMRMRIKMSLIKSEEKMCPVLYKSDRIQVVFNPQDVNDRNLPSSYIVNQTPDNSITVGKFQNSEFHLMKDGVYEKVVALTYGKTMKNIFGDNEEWMKKAGEKGWLKFDNIVENIRYYEATKK